MHEPAVWHAIYLQCVLVLARLPLIATGILLERSVTNLL